MQPVHRPGAFGEQVVASIRKQPQHHGVVLGYNSAQPFLALGDGGHGGGVGGVGLAGAARAEQPRLRGQLGGDVELTSVASVLLTKSGRAILDALLAGEQDPQTLAELAKGRLRAKIPATDPESPHRAQGQPARDST